MQLTRIRRHSCSGNKSSVTTTFSGMAALNGLWDQADIYSGRKVWYANTGHLGFADDEDEDSTLIFYFTGFVGGLEVLTGICIL